MIKTILWDVDGTLLDFIYSEHYALKKTFYVCGGVELTDEDIAAYSKINDKYWTKFDNGIITKNDIYVMRFTEFMEFLGLDKNKMPQISEMNEFYQNALGEKYRYLEKGREVVEDLKGFCRQYVVTNGSTAAQMGRLKLSGLMDMMDGVFISEQLGTQKPNKEFFEKCAGIIPDYNKSETIIIGDSLTSDIQGGNNADILTCWYNPEGKENTKNLRVDYEIKQLEEVYKIVGYK